MSSSSRISLQDCLVELQVPAPSSLPHPPSASAEEQTLLAAEARARELTEAYVGDTLFLVVTITAPAGGTHSAEALYQALESFGDVSVTMGPNRSAARACSLPVLRESAWIGTTHTPAGDAGPTHNAPATLLCKGLWTLVRTPPEHSRLADALSVTGKQEIFVAIREKSVSHGLRNSPVWATIDRASRLFGKALALSASKPILVNLPLEIACRQIRVSQSADKAFVCITARNATGDATLSIVPPYINVNQSRVVTDPEVNPRAAKPGVSGKLKEEESGKAPDIQMALDDRYEFVPTFAGGDPADEDEMSGELGWGAPPSLSRTQSSGTSTSDDYGLFIPSFNHWQKRAVLLGPREVFNFVYKVVQRGHSQHRAVAKESWPRRDDMRLPGKGKEDASVNKLPKLKPGTCLETTVAVAWNCLPRESIYDVPQPAPEKADSLQREMSSGGVLATGKRGNVAVRLTCVHWRPPALIDGVVVAFSGPAIAAVGAKLSVSVTILNQSGDDLGSVAVLVQQNDDISLELLALRTVIAVGRITTGEETTLQLPCIALKPGTLSLGPVQVIDRSASADDQEVWTSDAAYEVFVVDPGAPVPGDPVPP